MRVWVCSLLICAVAGAQLPNDAALPLDPDLRHFQLENGLSVYIRHNEEPENRMELHLVVDAGSILEDDDQLGLAHFLEHMAFNGTEHFAKQELVAYMESIGMEFGADVNAHTTFDETVYMLQLPTDSEKILEDGLMILRDWAGGITLDPEEIDKERGVVLEEWRLSQGAGQRIGDKQLPVVFKGSRYPDRLPIGDPEILRTAPPEALRRFYEDWYRPELMAVIAVGDFDVADVERRIRERFADLPAVEGGRERTRFDVPILPERNVSIVNDPEATQIRTSFQVKLPRPETGTVESFRQGLIESLATQMLNQRMAELTQRPDPPFIFAGAFLGGLSREARQFNLAMAVDADHLLSGPRAALLEWERAVRHGFSAGELQRAKANTLRQAQAAYEERENIDSAQWAAEHRAHFLTGDVSMGAEDYWQLVQELVGGIQLFEVDVVPPSIWNSANRTILSSGPSSVRLPDEPALLALLDEMRAASVEPYVDEGVDGRFLTVEPVAGQIVEERFDEPVGVHTWTLSNGIRVLLKPTDHREDEILIQGISPGGHSLVSDEDFEDAAMAASFAEAGGLGELDAIALGKALAGKRLALRLRLQELNEWVRGASAPEDLETWFQLLHASILSPRDDASAARALQQRQVAALRNQSLSPELAFADTLRATLSRYHPRRPFYDAEMVERFDYDNAMRIYRDRFADMGDFTFYFVGNFELDTMRPLITRYLASLPSLPREDQWRDVGVRVPDGVVERVVRAGQEPKAAVALVFHGSFPWEDRQQRYVFNALSSLLQIRLRTVLREDMGGTYGVAVQGAPERDPEPSYQLRIQFGCDPERVDELVGRLWDSLRSLKSEGPVAANVAAVQEQDRRRYEESQSDNGWWLTQIIYRDQYDLDLDEILDYLPLVDALQPQELQGAAQRYLDEANVVRVTLLPAADR